MAIESGDRVEVVTALGERVVMRALGGPEQGRDFEVVWVATEDDYAAALEADEKPEGIPWPADAVSALEASQ